LFDLATVLLYWIRVEGGPVPRCDSSSIHQGRVGGPGEPWDAAQHRHHPEVVLGTRP